MLTRRRSEADAREIGGMPDEGRQAESEMGDATSGADQIADAIEQIREAAAIRHSSESRIRELEMALAAAREQARRDLELAEERVDEAEARSSAEAERAASAERRLQVAEDRLDQVMAVIESELMPRTARI
jgi:hypothetical protein